jgi:hypothetical protein
VVEEPASTTGGGGRGEEEEDLHMKNLGHTFKDSRL